MHIGLFDSGVGGLTVLRELKEHLPQARFSYLGDTARLPYGNKAPETLIKYTHENIQFLESLKVDTIVIACHSASSVALNLTESPAGLPIFNVIHPSCQEAIAKTKSKKVGVMATKATTRSQSYPKHILSLNSSIEVISQECPLLVPLVEEGLLTGKITELILESYLTPLLEKKVDTILLGCTHYPILGEEIKRLCGSSVQLVNPARAVARQIQKVVKKSEAKPELLVYLTDHAPHFLLHAHSLLGDQPNLKILEVENK